MPGFNRCCRITTILCTITSCARSREKSSFVGIPTSCSSGQERKPRPESSGALCNSDIPPPLCLLYKGFNLSGCTGFLLQVVCTNSSGTNKERLWKSYSAQTGAPQNTWIKPSHWLSVCG